jgi:signal transduction histidine kinase
LVLKKSSDDSPESSPVFDRRVINDSLLLYAVLSHLEEGVVVLDREGHVSLINSSAQRMVPLSGGLSVPFLSPEAWGAYLPDSRTLFPAEEFPVTRALRGENAEPIEFLARHARAPEGLWIRASARPLVGPNGAKEGCVVFLRDVTAQKQMEKDLLEVSGAEKKRIGQELHDGVCQILTGIRFMCNVLIGKLSARAAPEAAAVAEIQHLINQALMETDVMAKGMIPVLLEVEGLVSALDELASQTARLYRISCRFICEKTMLVLNPEVALNVYRIAQEALTNAVKHGQAKNIVLWLTQAEGRYTLILKDDGSRPAQPSLRRGMGQRIMDSRAHQIGAELQFERLSGGGTLLTCEFSDRPPASAAEPAPHEKSKTL